MVPVVLRGSSDCLIRNAIVMLEIKKQVHLVILLVAMMDLHLFTIKCNTTFHNSFVVYWAA